MADDRFKGRKPVDRLTSGTPDERLKEAAQILREEFVRKLGLMREYRRTYTSTGVFRRLENPEKKPKSTMNERSLANLEKGRPRKQK